MEGFPGSERIISSPEDRLARFLSDESVRVNKQLEGLQTGITDEKQVKISEDFRIQPPDNIYSDKDKNYVQKLLDQWQNGEELNRGDLFEQFITALLVKKLKGRYIVTRASLYDDFANGVDNFLVDAKTGAVVCALDEINQTSLANVDPRFKSKSKFVQDVNWGRRPNAVSNPDNLYDRDLRYGASVKYGLILKPGSSDGRVPPSVTCGPVNNIPVFLISLDSAHIDRAIEEFDSQNTKHDSVEDKLYLYFLRNVLLQINNMRNKHSDDEDYDALPGKMKSRINDFRTFIESELARTSGQVT